MTAPVFIARIIGPLFVALGVGILLNQMVYAAMIGEAGFSPALIYFSGLLALVAGIAMLNVHRAWTPDWRVVITILGWLFVIAGLIRIVLPRVVIALAPTVFTGSLGLPIAAVIVLVVGGFLSFKGYWR